ncbi:MAG: family 10 glycosylhydrolase [Paludibacteraceae bacterium]|nr:family 10 glycosylhydrolase [Paludibacteraceae bacterium]
MKFVKQISFLALGLCMALSLHAQPKREFRASWLTTVWAIDWPNPHSQASAAGQQQQQNYMISLIKLHEKANLNAIFFQVRGFCDAMYKSKYEPWSQYLTGTRGGEPTYDPLQLVIDSAHARGIEVHAWLNPYRYASSDATYGKNHPKDYYNTNPEWLVKCGDITILNPSLPEVREQICKVVVDILENYDVDGIIFDDYFHQSGYLDSYDDAQYNAYKDTAANVMTRADWRRAQNNLMVRKVNDAIKATKPWVKFGIGPAGVAGKANTSAPVYGVEPCPTPSSDWQYNQIYADPLAWYNEKTIDYMSPQIYWTINSWANYDVIAKWWSDMACHFNRHMYVSHTLQNMVSDNNVTSGKHDKQEIGAQIELNRLYDRQDAPGSCWYSFSTGMSTKDYFNYIESDINTNAAVVPQMSWYSTNECIYVSNITKSGDKLTWKAPNSNLRYVVYQIPKSEVGKPGVAHSSKYLLGTTYTNEFNVNNKFALDASIPSVYAVAVLDRFGNEYPARTMDNTTWGKSPVANIVYPVNNSTALMPCNVTWNAVKEADSYFFQLSKSSDFSEIDYEYEVADTTFYLGKIYWLKSDGTYYWRVRTRSINKEDSFTKIHTFEGSYFRMQSPAEGDTCDFATPTFVCDSVNYSNVLYTFELASNAKFDEASLVHVGTSSKPRYTLPFDLLASRDYYVRATALFNGVTVMTTEVKFRTKAQFVPIPEITWPINGLDIQGKDLKIAWKQQASSGFQVELSTRTSFAPRYTTKIRIDDPTVFSTTTTLDPGKWYIRMQAVAEGGYTESSNVVEINMGVDGGVNGLEDTSDVEDVNVSSTPTKFVENGHVYILRNGKRYNLLGTYAQ